MYDLLIDRVVQTFSEPGEDEASFMARLTQADQRLWSNFRQGALVCCEPYAVPIIRAAYLLRYLGHYTLQLGDLLGALQDHDGVAEVLCRPHLKLLSLCGGPCPEAIALAVVHQQAQGQSLIAAALDRQAKHWKDCWPISAAIAETYGPHPSVQITGMNADLAAAALDPELEGIFQRADVLTLMNGLNELMAMGEDALRRRLRKRLARLPAGSLVLVSDLATYRTCEQGMAVLHRLFQDLGAEVVLENITPSRMHEAKNDFVLPPRIASIYSGRHARAFRKHIKQLQLAVLVT